MKCDRARSITPAADPGWRFNPFNAEATFVKSPRKQIFLKNI